MISCPCCQIPQSQLYCSRCLNDGLLAQATVRRALESQSRGAQHRVAIVVASAKGVSEWRKLRAEVHSLEQRIKVLQSSLDSMAAGPIRPRPRNRRIPHSPIPAPNCAAETQDTKTRLIHARQVLVREAVSIFGVRHDRIAGMPLPRPDDFRQHPTSHTNAAILHTVHLLSLIKQYLAVEVPFTPVAHPASRPQIVANTPFTSTSKYRTIHTIQVRSRPTIQALTAFALFAHSIAYLAWSQGVSGIGIRGDVIESDESETEDPESQILIPATAVLELLDTMSKQSTLGSRSHAPGVDRLHNLGFGLDVKRVVQALLALTSEEEGWHMVEHSAEKMHAG